MIPIKTTNCTWVNDGKYLTVTTGEFVGSITFDVDHIMVFPPHSKVKLCDMEFGRVECPTFDSIGREYSEDLSGAIWNVKLNGEILWESKMNKSQEIVKGFLAKGLNLAEIERSLQIPQGSLKEILEGREPEIGEAGLLSMLEQFPWFIQVANFNFFQGCVTSYKGCHPDIAASLKRGEHIKCFVNKCSTPIDVIAFVNKNYITKYGVSVSKAVPVKREVFVIGPEAMMKELVDRGYEPDADGDWENHGLGKEFSRKDWVACGKRCYEDKGTWEPWMLIEKELEG